MVHFNDVDGVRVWTSKGNGTFTVEPSFPKNGYRVDSNQYAFLTGNFSSDSKTDLIHFVNRSYVHVWNSSGPLPDLCTTFTDGYGHQERLVYKPITDSSVYTKDSDSVYPTADLQGPIYVVHSHLSGDGLGSESERRYTYGGAKSDQNRGFLGFRWQKTTDVRSGITEHSEYRQDYPFIGFLRFSEARLASGTLLSYSTNTYAVKSPLNALVHFPYVSQSVSSTYELNGSFVSSVTSSTEYDDWGNLSRIEVSSHDAFRKVTVNSYVNDTNRWIIGKVTRAAVTAFSPDHPAQTRVSAFDYYADSGLLLREIVEPDAPDKLTTEYERDPYGNVTKSTTSGLGFAARSARTTYDSRGRFPTEAFNAKNHKESHSFDERFGTPARLVGPNNLATTWEYDGFGRKIRETRSDGSSTRWSSVRAEGRLAPTLARYALRSKSSGQAPVTAYFDELGREIRTHTFGFLNRDLLHDTKFDALGRMEWRTRKYFEGDPAHLSHFTYDVIGRPVISELPDGSKSVTAYFGNTTIVTNSLGQKHITIKNSQGWLVSGTDNDGNTVRHFYDSFGNLLKTVDPAGNEIVATYDARGRKTSIRDPDAGLSELRHNALGEVVWQRDANQNVTEHKYDELGRVLERSQPEGIVRYVYDLAPNGIGRVANITSYNGFDRAFSYDALSRPSIVSTIYRGEEFSVGTLYDSLSRVDRVIYPTGFTIQNRYNERGYLAEVLDFESKHSLWRAVNINASGQMLEQSLGNNVSTVREYDPFRGWVTGIRSGISGDKAVQNLGFAYDTLGNLRSRSDDNQALTEFFDYDNLNRLRQASIPARLPTSVDYDALGNITYKSDVGTYTYDRVNAGPHAVTKAGNMSDRYRYDANGNQLSGNGRESSYASFNKPLSAVKAGRAQSLFAYDSDNNLLEVASTVGGETTTTLYIGSIYQRVTNKIGVEHRHYVSAGSALVAIRASRGTTASTHYVHKDHLGSVESISNEAGKVIERFNYDAFGQRRGDNWQAAPPGSITSKVTDRGFTQHVQLDALELIHMGGRAYDPVLGRFVSPDPLVRAPDYLQAFNRYSYAENNPLSSYDPSGFGLFKKITKGIKNIIDKGTDFIEDSVKAGIKVAEEVAEAHVDVARFAKENARTIAAIAAAAAIMAATGGVGGAFLAGFASSFISSKGNLRAALIGGVTAVAFFGAGELAAAGHLNTYEAIAAHGVVGGTSAKVQGGNFWQGFASAAIAKSFAGKIDAGFKGDELGDVAKRVIASSTLGGLTSELTGGSFSDGAMTGAFSRLFNDEAHRIKSAIVGRNIGMTLGGIAGGVAATGTVIALEIPSGGTVTLVGPAAIGAGVAGVGALGAAAGYGLGYFAGAIYDSAIAIADSLVNVYSTSSDEFSRGGPPRESGTGNYLPDPAAEGPHSTLGTRVGHGGKPYTQGATFDSSGKFVGRTDVTDHGRGDHANPHFHPADGPNRTKGREPVR